MPLAPGTRLGSYEIVAQLGAGGMGSVYRARDARLDRDVAIKVLADALLKDDAALARFEREAISIARLSHPNILSIFEFVREGHSSGSNQAETVFVVMELVDGETLRSRLDGRPLPSRKAAAYALQIARGLGAAHARGVVHRDLKPENVMITRDDHVKILDFGLAKSTTPVKDGSQLPTQLAETTPGTVLGTFGYMAPEQVRGLAVDHRADMFAFGAVLYEMVSGERAFRGETAADTMTAILAKEPPELDSAKLAIPPGLERIIRRCLEKSAELRFQSANDLAFALETLTTSSGVTSTSAAMAQEPAGPAAHGGVRRTTRLLPWLVAGVAAIAAAAGWWPRSQAATSAARFEMLTRITELAGEETAPALSPDGTTVAYAVRGNGGWDIYAQRVGGRNATPILNDPKRNESGPAFSPDGSSIAFHESDPDGGIFVAGATGESVRRLTDIGFHPAWSPDSKRIAFTTEEIFEPAGRQSVATLYVVDAAGGQPRKVTEGDAAQPSWSPSGTRIVYWANTTGQRDLFTVAAAGGERIALTNDSAIDWSPVWSPDGQFVYFSSDRGGETNLWRLAVDSSGRPSGAPEPITMGAQASSSLPSFSREGNRLAFRSRISSVNPFDIPIDPVTLKTGEPRLMDSRITIRLPSSVSRDGSLIAYFAIGERQEDLFVGPPDGPMRRVIDDAWRDRAPAFTPDGKSLLFYSNRSGSWQAWLIGLDGSGLRQVGQSSGGAVYPLMSPSGDRMVVSESSAGVVRQMMLPSGELQLLEGANPKGGLFTPTSWSPDGARLVGYLASPSGLPTGVGVFDFAAKSVTTLNNDPTYSIIWMPDSRRVVYFAKDGFQLVVVDTVTKVRTVLPIRLPAPAHPDLFSISPDGRHIYYGGARAEADIWILERK